MPSYNLQVLFSESDVSKINKNNQKLTLIKQTAGGETGPSIAWLTINPFENNKITWDSRYGIYASTTRIEAGATIHKMSSENPATSQNSYPFENGIFNEPLRLDETFKNTYQIQNESNQDLTFGLTQGVTANGNKFDANPLNAVTVFTQQTATFSAIEKLTVYLSSYKNNGVVVTTIASDSIELDFTSAQNSDQSIKYADGQFIMIKN